LKFVGETPTNHATADRIRKKGVRDARFTLPRFVFPNDAAQCKVFDGNERLQHDIMLPHARAAHHIDHTFIWK